VVQRACADQAAAGDPELMTLLAQVNVAVNHAITYQREVPVRMPVENRPGKFVMVERWEINPKVGDCEDYAVSKMVALIKAGLPRSALRFAVYSSPRWNAACCSDGRDDRWNAGAFKSLRPSDAVAGDHRCPLGWRRAGQPSGFHGILGIAQIETARTVTCGPLPFSRTDRHPDCSGKVQQGQP
jgi:hypothetical protein